MVLTLLCIALSYIAIQYISLSIHDIRCRRSGRVMDYARAARNGRICFWALMFILVLYQGRDTLFP